MWSWIRSRRRRYILTVVGLESNLHELAKDIHWTHGMLDTFGTCDDFRCKRAREMFARSREVGWLGHDINKSVNLWNDNDELREFIKQLLAQVEAVASEIKPGASPAVDKLRAIAAKPPFALHWGEKPYEERRKRYG